MITRESLIALRKKNPTKFLEVLPYYVASVGLENLKKHSAGLGVFDNKLLDKMIKRIHKIAKTEDDSIRIYTLCANCERIIKVIGRGKVSKEEDVYII